MEEEILKKSSVFEINALQVVAGNSACSEGNTLHR